MVAQPTTTPEGIADPAAVALDFKRWIENRKGVSPLYEAIVEEIIKDKELLQLIAEAGSLKFIYNRFMGAVHYLLLEGIEDPLAAFYGTVSKNTAPVSGAFPHFRRFCFQYKSELLQLVASREVQINEVRRCATLLPALTIISRRNPVPLALLDVGACAGLNLNFDHYFYNYGLAGTVGDHSSMVRIHCDPRGSKLPIIPPKFPDVVWRKGIDLNPIDATDSHATNWLVALVSPDDVDRLRLLYAALDIARYNPPMLVKGAASDVVESVLASVPDEFLPCIFHSFTVQDFTQDDLQRFESVIQEFGFRRNLHIVSLEWNVIDGRTRLQDPIPLKLISFDNMTSTVETLAMVDNRGACEWLEWS